MYEKLQEATTSFEKIHNSCSSVPDIYVQMLFLLPKIFISICMYICKSYTKRVEGFLLQAFEDLGQKHFIITKDGYLKETHDRFVL